MKKYIIILTLLFFIILIIFLLKKQDTSLSPKSKDENKGEEIAKVTTKLFVPENFVLQYRTEGKTKPFLSLDLISNTEGVIKKVLAKKGDYVEQGSEIVKFDLENLETELIKAESDYIEKKMEYKAIENLHQSGFQAKLRLLQAKVAYNTAKSYWEKTKDDLNKKVLRAPISGILNDIIDDTGVYVKKGEVLGKIIQTRELIVQIDLNPKYINQIKLKDSVHVECNEQKFLGEISYISFEANPQTNTYDTEALIKNKNLKAGQLCKVRFDLEKKMGIQVSPSVLSFDNKGNIGVKYVENQKVFFQSVQVENITTKNVWVTNINKPINIIVLGQSNVNIGEPVKTKSIGDLYE